MEQESSPTITQGTTTQEVVLQDVVDVINSLIGAVAEKFDRVEAKISDLNTTIGTIKRDVRKMANELGERSTEKETTVHKKLNVLYEQIELGKSLQEEQEKMRQNETERMGKALRGIQEQYESVQAQNIRLEKGFYESLEKTVDAISSITKVTANTGATDAVTSTPVGVPEPATRTHARLFRIASPSPDRVSERTDEEDRGRVGGKKQIGSLFETPSRKEPVNEKTKPQVSAAVSAANTTMATITTDTAKAIMKKPAEYDGKRGLITRSFITKMETYFRTRESLWGDEEKIYATLTNIGGTDTALSWALPLLKNYNNGVDHPYLEGWAAFKEAFLLNFDDPTYTMRANEELMSIQQSGSVHEYATRFRSLAAQVTWDKNALVAAFKKGLKTYIKQELLRATLFEDETMANLEQWIALALKVEGVHWRHTGSGKKEDA
ncbi:hypothetical protein CTheo_8079 [Ceratobasidium theobromae]|uniref:Retrotransposon gag domain-containing protein n=1 Tax=Ceratobasidium theobromae TaxID=1582974 RepID=A0A5N5Q9R3_9AGAM|nr:hypothetical protein CTheo_8079 [Ceratobasidium theobromae]